jgi:hypothetical protein
LAIGSLKTNVTLVWILTTVATAFLILGIAYFKVAAGDAVASTYLTTAGALGFLTILGGYWLLLHLILASVDFPINVPLGDLSRFYKKKEI